LTDTEEAVHAFLYPSPLRLGPQVRRKSVEMLVQRDRTLIEESQQLPDELAAMLIHALGLPRLALDKAVFELHLKLGPIPEVPEHGPISPWPVTFTPRRDAHVEFDSRAVDHHKRRLLLRAAQQTQPFFARVFRSAAFFWQKWRIRQGVTHDEEQALVEALKLADEAGEWHELEPLLQVANTSQAIPRHRRFLRDWRNHVKRILVPNKKRWADLKQRYIEFRSRATSSMKPRHQSARTSWGASA